MRHNVRTYVMCPKCRAMEVEFAEVSEAFEKWVQDEKGAITEGAETGAVLGDVIRVEARCLNPICGHRWTVRGIKLISNLPNWPTGEESETVTVVEEAATTEVEEPAVEPEVIETLAAEPVEVEADKGKGKGGRKKKAA